MNNIVIDESQFTPEHPSEPGLYLWKSNSKYTGSQSGVDIVSIWVVMYPEKDEYGMHWESYLGVPSYQGRSVNHLQGKFLKIDLKY